MTYYVSSDGADINPGTAELPFRTLQKAADTVAAGDTVLVNPGSYTGFMLGWGENKATGEPGKPITFHAAPGVIITVKTKSGDGINVERGSWIIIEGFTVRGMKRAGIRAAGGGSNITIRHNTCENNGVWGIFTSHIHDVRIEGNTCSGSLREHGIYHSNSGDRPVIRNNEIFGNKGSGIHINGDQTQGDDGIISHAVIEGNRIHDNGLRGSGINCDGVVNSTIKGNVIYDAHNSGISLFKFNGAVPSTGNLVTFNTIVNAADSKNAALNIQDGSTGNKVFNNILLTHRSKDASYLSISDDSLPGYTSDFNVISPCVNSWTSIEAWRTKTGQDIESIVSYPAQVGFADIARNDYRLAPTSIAIRAGRRPDIGAIQMGESTKPVDVTQ